MLICDGVRAPLMAAIPLLHVAGLLSFPAPVAARLRRRPSSRRRRSRPRPRCCPTSFPDDEVRLGEANTLLQTANRLTSARPAHRRRAHRRAWGNRGAAHRRRDVRRRVRDRGAARSLAGHRRGGGRGPRLRRRLPLPRAPAPAALVGRAHPRDALWLALFVALPVLVLERFGDQPEYVGLAFAGFGGGAIVGGVIAFKVIGTVDRSAREPRRDRHGAAAVAAARSRLPTAPRRGVRVAGFRERPRQPRIAYDRAAGGRRAISGRSSTPWSPPRRCSVRSYSSAPGPRSSSSVSTRPLP